MTTQEFKKLVKSTFNTTVSFKSQGAGTAFGSNGTLLNAKVKMGYDYELPENLFFLFVEKNITVGYVNNFLSLTAKID